MPQALQEATIDTGADSAARRCPPRARLPLPPPTLSFASDGRLAKRAAAGDLEAFATIFQRYQSDLYRFCVGILREPQDAQDAVQNTMVRAMRALPGETREMQLRPWLYRIAHNEAIELRRRERPAEPLAPTIDDGAGTEERVEHGVRLQTLLADIADLPERQRAALVMRELNGLAFGEIGAALGTSPGAVRQALYEARLGLGEMELGRDMDCDAAMRQVSDSEGRPRRRGVRAHLRHCNRCRHFQHEISERKGALAAISPLPGLAAASLLKGALGGSAAAAGGSGAGASAGTASGAGIGAGVLAGSGGVSGAAKAAAGLLAMLAVGTVAVDHGALVPPAAHGSHPVGRRADLGGSVPSAGTGSNRLSFVEATAGSASPGRLVAAGATVAAGRDRPGAAGRFTSMPDRGWSRPPRPPAESGTVGPSPLPGRSTSATDTIATDPSVDPSADQGRSGSAPVGTEAGGPGRAKGSEGNGREGSGASEAGGAGQAAHPEHPPHPEHPAHPESGGQAAKPAEATSAAPETAAGEQPEHPAHPEHPVHPAPPRQEGAEVEVTEAVEESPPTAAAAGGEAEHGVGLAKGHDKEADPTTE